MKKSYKIDVDCANCANLMEKAAKETAGVKDASVNFMALKMFVEFEEGTEPEKVNEGRSQGLPQGRAPTARSSCKKSSPPPRLRAGVL